MERAVKLTADYTKERKAFGQPIIEFQNTAFTLAERKTEAMIARVFVDWCVGAAASPAISTPSPPRWRNGGATQKQVETADECLQLHGGYGYMQEYPISRMFVDARDPEDLRRHQRDHEAADRALAVASGGRTRMLVSCTETRARQMAASNAKSGRSVSPTPTRPSRRFGER